MSTRSAQRESFLATVLNTAVEGGINYYAEVEKYHWYDPDIEGGSAEPSPAGGGNATVTIFLPEGVNGDEETYTANIETIATGIAKLLSGEVKAASHIVDVIRWSDQHNDFHTEMDAVACDVVLQAGLFGWVVFG